MKTFVSLALCLAALTAFGAAPSALENHRLTINGRPVGKMVVLQGGLWAVSLEDLARALGAPMTLEPVLSLQGNRLLVKGAASQAEYKPQKPDGSSYGLKQKVVPGQILQVLRPGLISSHVTMVSGKSYVPVSDVLHAFGDGSVRGSITGNLLPNQNMNVNVVPSQKGIIAVLIGL